MKLNEEQVELINSFLVKNEVVFDDIRLEIIDHIACDVEEIYADIPFPDAIKIVLKKWEGQVQKTSSFWISSWSSFPRIITKKLQQLFIPQIIIVSLIVITSLIINEFFSNVIVAFKTYESIFNIFYLVWLVVVSVFGIRLFFSRAQTTYKYIFKRNFYHIYLLTILTFFVSTRGLMIGYLLINLSFTVFLVQNYKAHFKFLKRI